MHLTAGKESAVGQVPRLQRRESRLDILLDNSTRFNVMSFLADGGVLLIKDFRRGPWALSRKLFLTRRWKVFTSTGRPGEHH